MQKCLTCGIEYPAGRCPACDAAPLPSTKVQKSLNQYSLMLAPGVFCGLVAYIVFPPLAAGPLVAFGVLTLSLPFVLQCVSVLRKRLSDDVDQLRTAYVYSSLALLLIALLPLLNGWLDKSPVDAVRATVLQKSAVRQRSVTTHRLTVSSLRPGHSEEELTVGLHTYNDAFVGKTVTVEMHKGFFGLPWYSGVSSR
jgi:hypothetical protein